MAEIPVSDKFGNIAITKEQTEFYDSFMNRQMPTF